MHANAKAVLLCSQFVVLDRRDRKTSHRGSADKEMSVTYRNSGFMNRLISGLKM